MPSNSNIFKKKIAIIGLGYVGLPLLIEASKKFKVLGFDINKNRIRELNKNYDNTNEISPKKLKKYKQNIKYSCDDKSLKDKNFYIITVPTPIYRNKKPDLSYVKKATQGVSKYIKKGDVIIYESTVYPGVTEEYCGNIISKKTGLIFNKDFYLGYSPERVNPGDKKNTIDKIVKVVSGSNEKTLNLISNFYKKIIPAGIFKAKSIKVAESAKVIENIQRDLNISLVNELSIIFRKLGLNIYDILSAARTKWNFLDFKPGLVGGHCIGVDPYYLTYLSNKIGYNPKTILSGRNINENMTRLASAIFFSAMKKKKINIKKSKILFLGLAFKENCSDLRNSKNIELCSLISNKANNLDSFDPYLKRKNISNKLIKKLNILFRLPKKKYDVVILAVPHDYFLNKKLFDLKKFFKAKYLFYDLKNKFTKLKPDLTL
jgi:UDP-N-acetyl-D-galactosamine dehydrogenase